MNNIYKLLFEQKHITEKQFTFLESIRKEEIISLYYELRTVLYIGILLFTGGIGYLIYENIGSLGHILLMLLLGTLIITGFYYISKFAKPYAHDLVTVKLVYFDYLLILVSLLIIGLFTYIQVYFEIVAILASWSSYLSASLFFFMAYRYDNRALLAMGITALAAALGFTFTPIAWTANDGVSTNYTHIIAILLGVSLYVSGYLSEKENIKPHFKFTYQNFGLITFYLGCLSGIFYTAFDIPYTLVALGSAVFMSFYTWKTKAFLFFLYSNISAYIAFSYLFFELVSNTSDGYILLIYYFPCTCIGYIVFLVKKKSHFAHE
ncbi:hypothetical protein Q4566_00610 [Tamlana sp. 2_MG-2023]|uniref:hypothetical protein n=1 Tax=unclassified Tamlana TaxID=2614803 RepID=UPI0026E4643E|nr:MULTISPECIES: hypothetical protein [unclassified Tamlana]MDO6758684.1 hypothetical protein [Tamlana sp. 2_MG-2023]MDO6789383.1 hypothetical protein [Tamlana sp. 1_MG-2023]